MALLTAEDEQPVAGEEYIANHRVRQSLAESHLAAVEPNQVHPGLRYSDNPFSIRLDDVRFINSGLLHVRGRVRLRRTRRFLRAARGVSGAASVRYRTLGRRSAGVGSARHRATTHPLDQIFRGLILEVRQNAVACVEGLQRPCHRVRRTFGDLRFLRPRLREVAAIATPAMRTAAAATALGMATRARATVARAGCPSPRSDVCSSICRRTASAALRARDSKSLILRPLAAIDERRHCAPGSSGF